MDIEVVFYAIMSELIRWILPILAFLIVFRCVKSLFRTCTTPTTMAVLIDPITNAQTPLLNWENSVGRAKSCDVFIDYPVISRNHAVIFKTKTGWQITDTGSQTGVFVNGEKISARHNINSGDMLNFGTAPYLFKSYDNFSSEESQEEE